MHGRVLSYVHWDIITLQIGIPHVMMMMLWWYMLDSLISWLCYQCHIPPILILQQPLLPILDSSLVHLVLLLIKHFDYLVHLHVAHILLCYLPHKTRCMSSYLHNISKWRVMLSRVLIRLLDLLIIDLELLKQVFVFEGWRVQEFGNEELLEPMELVLVCDHFREVLEFFRLHGHVVP